MSVNDGCLRTHQASLLVLSRKEKSPAQAGLPTFKLPHLQLKLLALSTSPVPL